MLHLGIVTLLTHLGADAFTASALYFFAGFPLAALTMTWLARRQGLAAVPSIVVGVLYAVLPGHQDKFGHLWLASYWTLPLGLWLVLETARGRPLLRRPWRSRATAGAVAAMVAVGLSGVYFAGYTLLLLAAVAVFRRLSTREPAGLLRALPVVAVIGGTALVPLVAARLAARSVQVVGTLPATRHFGESEIFAGKLVDLVLPWAGHRVDALARITWFYNTAGYPSFEQPALGVVPLIGCAVAVGAALTALIGQARVARGRVLLWSGLILVSLSFYVLGGMGSLLAFLGLPQLRTWSRMVLVIALLSLLVIASLLTRLQRRRGLLTVGVVGALVLVIGVLDQTSPERAPAYAANRARLADLKAYTAGIERALEPGCAVFQLPVTIFPEANDRAGAAPYDQILPYLAGSSLRWSAGAMRGTAQAEWQRAVRPDADARTLQALGSAGFCAVEIDTAAYSRVRDPLPALTRALGQPVSRTADGRFVALDLAEATRGVSAEAGRLAADALLHPVVVDITGWPVAQTSSGPRQWLAPGAGIRVLNLDDSPATVTLQMVLEAADLQTRSVRVEQSGTVIGSGEIAPDRPLVIDRTITVPPGSSRVDLVVSGEPLRLREGNITTVAAVTDLSVLPEPGRHAASSFETFVP